jgi:predicted flap endonuclease-1-like 5' DNA nuclease
MDLASFFVGLVVAWIIALLVYWFGVQRDETERAANTVPLNEHLVQMQEAEDRITQLETDLQAVRKDLEEAQAAAQAAEQSKAPEPRSAEPSDFKRIEGIGPKIEEILNNAGIHTFGQLADTAVERLQAILEDAGESFRLADPGTWPQQARLAAEEKWDELSTLQEELKGGR